MPPTHMTYDASAGSDSEHHVAPEVPTLENRPEAYPSTLPNQPNPQQMQPLSVQTAPPMYVYTPINQGYLVQSSYPPQFPNINAATFQPSQNASPATTASSSPVPFQENDVAAQVPESSAQMQQYPQIPQQSVYSNPIPIPQQPMMMMNYGVPPEASYSYNTPPPPTNQMYATPPFGSPHAYAIPQVFGTPPPQAQTAPQTQITTTQQQQAPQYTMPQGAAYASQGSSAYSTPAYYGSPAPAPAPPMHQAVPMPPQQAQKFPQTKSIDGLPDIQGLNLNMAPMYKPSSAHNVRQPSDMRQVWHMQFEKYFSHFFGTWELIPEPEGYNGEADGIYEDTAKIRFVCKNCSHAWTSMQGKVKFWYKFNQQTSRGSVHFQLFGQKCKDCKEKKNIDEIQDSLWYPDEIEKVVHNIHSKVGMVYYNIKSPQIIIQRRVGRPKGQHNADLCAACQSGMCRRNSPNPFL